MGCGLPVTRLPLRPSSFLSDSAVDRRYSTSRRVNVSSLNVVFTDVSVSPSGRRWSSGLVGRASVDLLLPYSHMCLC